MVKWLKGPFWALLVVLVFLAGAGTARGETCSPACPLFHHCVSGQCEFNGGCEPDVHAGCGDCTCEGCVCEFDPYCCAGQWDALCVSRCVDSCGGCGVKEGCGDGLCTSGESCSNCPGDCGACNTPCGLVSSIGCCEGLALVRCQGGALSIENCVSAGFNSCGWSLDEDRYVCGGEGTDPSGTYLASCPSTGTDVVEEDALQAQCQGVGFSGCCIGNELVWCDWAGLHSLDCGGNPAPFNTCGWKDETGSYDCGGVGSDPTGGLPKFCPSVNFDVQEEVVVEPKCKVGTLVSEDCQDVGFQGCCSEDGELYFCESGKFLCRLDCGVLPAPSNSCGWHIAGASGYYDCGGLGEDPGENYPLICPAITVTTDVVEPDLVAPDKSCPSIPLQGCCDGTVLRWCEFGMDRSYDCLNLASDPVFGAYVYCGTNATTGKADCLKKPDPSPPECVMVQPVDDSPEVVEQVDDTVSKDQIGSDQDSDSELGEVEVIPSDDSRPEATEPFVIPNLDTTPADAVVDDGGGGGGGCSHSSTGTIWPLMLLFFLWWVSRRFSGRGIFES